MQSLAEFINRIKGRAFPMEELLHLKTIFKPGFQALVQLTTGTDCQSHVESKVKTNSLVAIPTWT